VGILNKVLVFMGLADEGESAEEPAKTRLPAWEERERRVSQISSSKKVVRLWTLQKGSEAKEVAQALKKGWLVIMDLSLLDQDDVKHVLNFTYGVIFAMQGTLKTLADRVFLLAPPGFEVFEHPFPRGGVKVGEVDASGHTE